MSKLRRIAGKFCKGRECSYRSAGAECVRLSGKQGNRVRKHCFESGGIRAFVLVLLLAGAPAIYFGYLAIRNNEPEREKAYIAIGIGVLDMIGFLILNQMLMTKKMQSFRKNQTKMMTI